MIIERVPEILRYREVLPGIEKGLEALLALGEHPAEGRYEFDGGFFTVLEGDTKSPEGGELEPPRRYIDVQFLLEGREEVVWGYLPELTPRTEYDGEKDIQMLTGKAEQCTLITAGMVWAAFPEDAHMPGRHTGEMSHYRKAVMKLPVKKEAAP